MKPPERSSDPCWYWKEYELERTAARMRNGDYGIPQPNLTDSQKVQIAYLLLAKHKPSDHFAVWIDEGRLRVRYGLQGKPVPLTWLHAIRLVNYFKQPTFRKTLAVAGIEKRRAKSA